VCRAGSFTGCGAPLGDAKRSGDCLWILFKNGFSFRKSFIVLVWKSNWADLGAFAAACAFGKIYETGLLVDFCSEASGLTLKIQKFCIG
jgi:hypothetical protein